jgi:aspartate/methionine/tyrosine aminotransferase
MTEPWKSSIPLEQLQERAFNLRWGTVQPCEIPLTAADHDLPMAQEITAALQQEVSLGISNYVPAEGLRSYRLAVSDFFEREKGGGVCAPERVIATNSAAAAIETWCKVILRPGDEIIIPSPIDFLLPHCARRAGATVISIPANPEFILADWAQALSDKTKAIAICHPHNPMGFCYNKETLENIAAFAAEHQLEILSDEVWSDLVWEVPFVSMLAITSQASVVYGFSKGYALAGMRLGCLILSEKHDVNLFLDQGEYSSTVNGVGYLPQLAGTVAMQQAKPWLEERKKLIYNVMRYAAERINRETVLKVNIPSATFVLWIEHPKEWDTMETTQWLRNESKVLVVPGLERWFGDGSKGHFRISCATTMEVMTEAMDRWIPAVNHWNNSFQR